MAALFENCNTCFNAELASCQESYTINVGLNAGEDYILRIEAIDGNIYENEITAGEGGVLEFDSEDYSEGLFNQYAGSFTLTIFDHSNGCVELNMCEALYPCINVRFVDGINKTEISCCD